MKKRFSIILLSLLLVTGVMYTPTVAMAAEDDHAADEHESAGGSAEGAGVLMIMTGLGVIGLIGGAYWSRQNQPETS